MAYRCLECGHIFEEGEQATWREYMGECHGSPAYDEFCGCPLCKGEFEETKQCKICGGEFLEEDLNGDCVCDGCLEQHKKDLKTCYNIAKTAPKEEIKINALLASVLNVEEIETILYHYLKIKNDVDCYKFIEQDKDWFAEKLAEEVSK
jgi:hypothetical protein